MSFGKQYSLFNDLTELEKMVNSLETYLKGDELYGSIGGGFFTGGTSAQLTVGAVLLRLRRIAELSDQLDAGRQQKLQQVQYKHETIFGDNQDLYVAKMEREAMSRLKSMNRFFEECREDPSICTNIYGPEVLRRTITEEILDVLNNMNIVSADLDQTLTTTDGRLRRQIVSSDFVWDDQLQQVYPKTKFWWMWMRPLSR